jgi:hypothetical protein
MKNEMEEERLMETCQDLLTSFGYKRASLFEQYTRFFNSPELESISAELQSIRQKYGTVEQERFNFLTGALEKYHKENFHDIILEQK